MKYSIRTLILQTLALVVAASVLTPGTTRAQTVPIEDASILGTPDVQTDVALALAASPATLEIHFSADGNWRVARVVGDLSVSALEGTPQEAQALSAALYQSRLVFGQTGYSALELQGWVSAGETFSVTLPCKPSTGFTWQVERPDALLAVEPAPNGIRPYTVTVGSPATCTYHVTAAGEGLATLSLVHRRPWLPDQPVERRVKIFASEAAPVALTQIAAAASLPLPEALPDDAWLRSEASNEMLPAQEPTADMQAQSLPSYFNWCDHGKCTPIRDQGRCGSCWAFATVGVMESAVLIARPDINPNTLDFSEQFLISCNRRGWGCNGGWWAHEYHTDLRIEGEPMAGPVGERFFRYQAADVPCNSPYPHFWQAKAWGYVDPNPNVRIPSVDALKRAILRYGPISVAVWVGDAFSWYQGGVFRTNEAPSPNHINHAVVLVGWDDSQQAWIMRNSWGTEWGERGYMRIGYGVSNIGYRAAYVDGVRLFNRRLFMPAARMHPPVPPAVFPIPDGDFEGRVEAWWLGGLAVATTSPRYSGERSMWLGGVRGYTDSIHQPLLVPPQATHLRFWRYVHGDSGCGSDFARVSVGGQVLRTYPLCGPSVTRYQWIEERIDIRAFRGQRPQVKIEAVIDQTGSSASFYVDDVAFVR